MEKIQSCTHNYHDGNKHIKCHNKTECSICKHCSSHCPGHFLIRHTTNKNSNGESKPIYNHVL